jgi:hypothetical protein
MSSMLRFAAAAGFATALSHAVGSTFAVEPADNASSDALMAPAGQIATAGPTDFPDVRLAAGATVGNQPVAVNPKNAARFAAAYVENGVCYVRTTANGGKTWATANRLPMPAGTQSCDVPALAWAPDGSRVYAAYSYERKDNAGLIVESGAVVSLSKDHGNNWSSPVKALRYTDTQGLDQVYASFETLRLATPLREANANWVYLVADVSRYRPGEIVFTRSADRTRTWSARELLGSYSFTFDFKSGLSIAGGPKGEVLVGWGFGSVFEPPALEVVQSGNHGATFADAVIAAPNAAAYHTAAVFSTDGTAHIAYDQCKSSDDCTTERVRYMYSSRAPYTSWSSPMTLNDDSGDRQVHPALSVSTCGRGTAVLHAVWIDNRLGQDKYNVYYRRKVVRPDQPWSPSLRVSEAPVAENFQFVLGLGAGADTAVALWGAGKFRDPGPVWASRIASGVSCP